MRERPAAVTLLIPARMSFIPWIGVGLQARRQDGCRCPGPGIMEVPSGIV